MLQQLQAADKALQVELSSANKEQLRRALTQHGPKASASVRKEAERLAKLKLKLDEPPKKQKRLARQQSELDRAKKVAGQES